jgi:hypothetical protein
MIRAVEEDAPGNRQVAEAYPLDDPREMPLVVSAYLDRLLERDQVDTSDFEPSGTIGASDDDIPF